MSFFQKYLAHLKRAEDGHRHRVPRPTRPADVRNGVAGAGEAFQEHVTIASRTYEQAWDKGHGSPIRPAAI